MPTIVWENDVDPTMMLGEFENIYLENLGGRVTKLVKRLTAECEQNAKTNARWTDRTTNARTGLTAIWNKKGDKVYEIMLYYDPEIVKAYRPNAPSSESDGYFRYGYSLEVLHDRRFSIIPETMEATFAELMSEIERLINNPRRRDK